MSSLGIFVKKCDGGPNLGTIGLLALFLKSIISLKET